MRGRIPLDTNVGMSHLITVLENECSNVLKETMHKFIEIAKEKFIIKLSTEEIDNIKDFSHIKKIHDTLIEEVDTLKMVEPLKDDNLKMVEQSKLDNLKKIDEERMWRGPGHFRLCRATSYHRIELCEGVTPWTLFMPGPHKREWGFLVDNKWIHNDQYLEDLKHNN